MTKRIDVCPLPMFATDAPLDGISVAIDVLRATTTITTALCAGAERVVPFATVEETLAAKKAILAAHPDLEGKVLLGGERGGLPIEGFDFGNSPDLYVPESVGGKTLLFTTTNGTKAILSCRGISLLASFLNAAAVVDRIVSENRDVLTIICAGTNGKFTEEDLLLAGMLADAVSLREPGCELNVQAEVSREEWRRVRSRPLVELLKESTGGGNLKRIHLQKDVADAARLDTLDKVAEFRVGEIRLSGGFPKGADK